LDGCRPCGVRLVKRIRVRPHHRDVAVGLALPPARVDHREAHLAKVPGYGVADAGQLHVRRVSGYAPVALLARLALVSLPRITDTSTSGISGLGALTYWPRCLAWCVRISSSPMH
jgi:hypothetical protein